MPDEKTTVSIRKETHGRLRLGAAVRSLTVLDALDQAVELWLGDADKMANQAAEKLGSPLPFGGRRRRTIKAAA